jgi:hypothetical protein
MNKRQLIKVILVNLAVTIFLSEIGCRIIGSFFLFQIPFLRQDFVILSYSPDLYPFVLHEIPLIDTNEIRVLILGGSAVTNTLCQLEERLNEGLYEKDVNIKFKIFNLSRFAHNTLDSRIKMEYLSGYHFDYIFVYDGINDTRANNCPAEVFKKDYSHIQFYNELQTIRRHPEIKYFSLPFYVDWVWQRLRMKTGMQQIISREYFVLDESLLDADVLSQKDSVGGAAWQLINTIEKNHGEIVGLGSSAMKKINQEWFAEGREIKSAESFRENYTAIIQGAEKMRATLIFSSYAHYLPADYSLANFLNKKLDYKEQRWPAEIYGNPANVAKGINVYNEIIKELVRQNQQIIFIDFAKAIPHNKEYFNDICHLTENGCQLLADSLVKAIQSN